MDEYDKIKDARDRLRELFVNATNGIEPIYLPVNIERLIESFKVNESKKKHFENKRCTLNPVKVYEKMNQFFANLVDDLKIRN